jgi:hypothetical protein
VHQAVVHQFDGCQTKEQSGVDPAITGEPSEERQ